MSMLHPTRRQKTEEKSKNNNIQSHTTHKRRKEFEQQYLAGSLPPHVYVAVASTIDRSQTLLCSSLTQTEPLPK